MVAGDQASGGSAGINYKEILFRQRGAQMDTEFADVIGHDVTTITCLCGNTVSKEGLIQANSQGVPVYAGEDSPGPAGLAAWPDDEDLYTLCPSCGRVYHDTTIEETGIAPVAFQVDVTAGPVAEAIRIHWDLNT
jgi:hypothetical protein